MKRRKGLAIKTVMIAAVAFLTLSTIGGALFSGNLGEFIKRGADNVGEQSSYTVQIESKEELSDLARAVYLRATPEGCKNALGGSSGNSCDSVPAPSLCHQNIGADVDYDVVKSNEEGFPGLEGSYLTNKPQCLSAGSTIAGGDGLLGSGAQQAEDSGNDMEGILSRTKFRITEDMTIDTEDGNTWIDNHFLAASPDSFKQTTASPEEFPTEARNCESTEDPSGMRTGAYEENWQLEIRGTSHRSGNEPTMYAMYMATDNFCDDRIEPNMMEAAERHFELAYGLEEDVEEADFLGPYCSHGKIQWEEEQTCSDEGRSQNDECDPDEIVDKWGKYPDDKGDRNDQKVPFIKQVYANGEDDVITNHGEHEEDGDGDLDSKVRLYKGDRGFIQVNKGRYPGTTAQNEGESRSDFDLINFNDRNDEQKILFPYIQITSVNRERATRDLNTCGGEPTYY